MKFSLKGNPFIMVGLAVITYLLFALLLGWVTAAALTLVFLFHEAGHVIAMWRCGLGVRGVYFLPMLGAAAVPTEGFRSYREEAYVAIAGPILGAAFGALAFVGYVFTGLSFFISVILFTALLNILNLLPIYPFDGGRVVAAVGRSISPLCGKIVLWASLLISFLLMVALAMGGDANFGLVAFMVLVAFYVTTSVKAEIGRMTAVENTLALRDRVEALISADVERYRASGMSQEESVKAAVQDARMSGKLVGAVEGDDPALALLSFNKPEPMTGSQMAGYLITQVMIIVTLCFLGAMTMVLAFSDQLL